MSQRTIVVIGGTSGIGLEIAKEVVGRGDRVILTGREQTRSEGIARSIGDGATGIALDISEPETIAPSLTGVGEVHGLVLAAIERDANTVREYDVARARRLVTLKLEPSVETGIVLFGGRAKDAPYPGSTTVATINGGVEGLVHSMALELAPMRVNGLHPGIIGDSPFWADKPAAVLEGYESRTPGGALATMADIVGATMFLLDNHGVSGTSLNVDRGWRLT